MKEAIKSHEKNEIWCYEDVEVYWGSFLSPCGFIFMIHAAISKWLYVYKQPWQYKPWQYNPKLSNPILFKQIQNKTIKSKLTNTNQYNTNQKNESQSKTNKIVYKQPKPN